MKISLLCLMLYIYTTIYLSIQLIIYQFYSLILICRGMHLDGKYLSIYLLIQLDIPVPIYLNVVNVWYLSIDLYTYCTVYTYPHIYLPIYIRMLICGGRSADDKTLCWTWNMNIKDAMKSAPEWVLNNIYLSGLYLYLSIYCVNLSLSIC